MQFLYVVRSFPCEAQNRRRNPPREWAAVISAHISSPSFRINVLFDRTIHRAWQRGVRHIDSNHFATRDMEPAGHNFSVENQNCLTKDSFNIECGIRPNLQTRHLAFVEMDEENLWFPKALFILIRSESSRLLREYTLP